MRVAKKRYKIERGMFSGGETKMLALRPVKKTSAFEVGKATKKARFGDFTPPARVANKLMGEGVVPAEALDPVRSEVKFRKAVFSEKILSVEQLSTVQENILEQVLKTSKRRIIKP